MLVTPFAGVWIEISLTSRTRNCRMSSLPLRECGLKSEQRYKHRRMVQVTPFAGVWIEIFYQICQVDSMVVTPFAGVWIEMEMCRFPFDCPCVTPFAGVWIEMTLPGRSCMSAYRHSLCGSVD